MTESNDLLLATISVLLIIIFTLAPQSPSSKKAEKPAQTNKVEITFSDTEAMIIIAEKF